MPSEYRDASAADDPGEIEAAVVRAEAYVRREGYAGWDPYDALKSPLFRLPGVGSSKLVRFGTQQVVRRLPVNVRPLLRIPKGVNPVTLGLALEAWAALARAEPARAPELRDESAVLVARLAELVSPGYSGACWGYDFAWQSRGTLIPAQSPTVVATVFVTNGLFEAYETFGLDDAFALCESATRFVLRDLNRTDGADGTFCWSYSPLDRHAVLNASAKGSRLCAQVHSVNADAELAEAARASVRYVVAHQRSDGAWPYAVDDPRTWVDNFHTAYVLDALDEWRRRTGDTAADDALARGFSYYRARLFDLDGVPRYYDTARYPVDATACGQALLTLVRFGEQEAAERLARWVVRNLQRGDGGFRYRVYRRHTTSIPYMRWSTAWILAGLATVLAGRNGATR
jgi:hypothetical protein